MGARCGRRAPSERDEEWTIVGESSEHQEALRKLRLSFGRGMRALGDLRKKELSHEYAFMTTDERWSWLTLRKVRAREFKEQQTLLEYLKRQREAQLAR